MFASAVVYFRMKVPVEASTRITVRLKTSPRDFLPLGERGVGSWVGSSLLFVVIEHLSISTEATSGVVREMWAGWRGLSVGEISSSLVGPFVAFLCRVCGRSYQGGSGVLVRVAAGKDP